VRRELEEREAGSRGLKRRKQEARSRKRRAKATRYPLPIFMPFTVSSEVIMHPPFLGLEHWF